ncbi:MAG TPA: hypothetical protein VME63_03330 [Dyella sp.]|uniref:hypothetical protein n=1 Tax=Dyella sp. TaxID=1869338 RepID=UPI002C4F90A2|nr:hypothetical protein [Dyella sp.]HTV84407.1 hypothetical protein [Dyella sp.]
MKKIKHKNLILLSFLANFFTWIAWLVVLEYFKPLQLTTFLNYSSIAFLVGTAFRWAKYYVYPLPQGLHEIQWPIISILLHLIPLLNLVAYALYFVLGGRSDVAWTLMFLAPFVAGTGIVYGAELIKAKLRK